MVFKKTKYMAEQKKPNRLKSTKHLCSSLEFSQRIEKATKGVQEEVQKMFKSLDSTMTHQDLSRLRVY